MSSLLNPGGSTAQEKNVPANPFKIFIRWQSTAGKWIVRAGGENKELYKPLELVVLDYLNTIQGGEIGVVDVWSKPYYRYTSTEVKVWVKQSASGKISEVAKGKVEDIYDKLRNDYKASKGVKCYVFLPQTGQIALLDLSGYSINPFYDSETSAEKPGIKLELEAVEVMPRPVYGTRYKPIISSLEVDKKTVAAAIDAFAQSGAIEYLNYMEGKETEATKPDAEVPKTDSEGEKKADGTEEKEKKNSDPWA